MRKNPAFLTTFLLLLAFSFVLPIKYEAGYPKPLGPELATSPRQSYRLAIEKNQVELVLLGDSQLVLGVDEAMLSRELDRSTYKIAIPGSSSAAWYLITRHNIVTANPPPRMLVVFFRDNILTVPGAGVYGEYYENIVYENTALDDSLFVQYSFIEQMNPVEKFAGQYLPLYSQRDDVRRAIDFRLRYALPGMLLDCGGDCTDLSMAEVFKGADLEAGTLSEAVAATDMYLYHPENLDFDARVEISYLPEFIRMAEEAGIRLVLVRMKTFLFADGVPQPQGLQEYIQDLKAYLEENDVPLLDYADDVRFTRDLYFDVYHMNEDGKAFFTKILSADLTPFLEEVP